VRSLLLFANVNIQGVTGGNVNIPGVTGGNVNILGGHTIGHSKQKSVYFTVQ
jgi:hypothetical protein